MAPMWMARYLTTRRCDVEPLSGCRSLRAFARLRAARTHQPVDELAHVVRATWSRRATSEYTAGTANSVRNTDTSVP